MATAPHHHIQRASRELLAVARGDSLEIGFDIYAITVVGALAGAFGSFFHRRSQEHDAAKAAASEASDDVSASGAEREGAAAAG